MIIQKLFNNVEDHNKSLQERVFVILTFIGMLSVFLLIFIGMIMGDNILNTLALVACFFGFLGVIIFSIKKRRVQTGATIIGVVLVVFLLPLSFICGGGIYGGSPLWFIFGFAFIGMTVAGKRKYVLMAIGAIAMSVSYYLAYMYPEYVAKHTILAAHMDSLISNLIVSILLVVMILFENRVYISENKLIEKQKEEIQKLSQSKSKFFSTVSHEIRTPIDTMVGFNELIIRDSDSEEITENALNIKSAGRLLLNLVNDVLDVAKLESGKMEIVPNEYDVISMLSETINMTYEEAHEKRLKYYVDIDPQTPKILIGDDIRIEQILINLLNNAIKYTNEGSITLSLRSKPIGPGEIMLVFTVEDTGIGIKKDAIAYVFDEFKRVNENGAKDVMGTGLGLTIVKMLTEQMNGEIQVNSIYTKGSSFVVTLPQEVVKSEPVGEITLEDLRNKELASEYRQSFEAPGARILIVDDNQMNRVVTKRLLRDTKMEIDEAASGIECLEKCANIQYECIFMDQVMPEMDGTECLRQIRQQMGGMNRETPVVVITAFTTGDDQAKFRMAGFDGYILKPVNGEMLENTLLRILPADLIRRTRPLEADQAGGKKGNLHKDRLPILITTESVCDLPPEMIEKMRIPIIPFSIRNKNGSFIDGVETETEGVLEYISENGNEDLFAESPSVQEYEEFFASRLDEADNVIHISMSGKAGGAYHIAMEAAASFDRVHIVDSESLSCGVGMLVLEAHNLVQAGFDAAECVRQLDKIKKRIHTSFLINNIDYLIKLGRINPRMKGISRIFMLKPGILFRDGRGTLLRMFMGAAAKAKKRYIGMQFDTGRLIDKRRVFITHTGLTASELDDILRWVGDEMIFDEVIVQKESAACAAIHGQGAFGIIFLYEDE
jgi:DegV family protein with EDD domain